MVEDDPAQARKARRLLDQAGERDERVFVDDIVIAEIEWVLDDAYGVPRHRILAGLQGLLADERFAFADRNLLAAALDRYQEGHGDLADYLLGLRGENAGCRSTYTFDRGLRGDPRFTVV
jgi:predicted nucleic-acid-binding protein